MIIRLREKYRKPMTVISRSLTSQKENERKRGFNKTKDEHIIKFHREPLEK